MRIALIQCSNEANLVSAVERAGMTAVVCSLNEPEETLREMQGYIIAGAHPFVPVMMEAAEQGKPILGMGDGAALLLETGLVPGLENHKPAITLAEQKHSDEVWVYARVSDQYQRNAFTRHLTPATILHLPVANTKTHFVMSDVLLQEIKEQGLNVFQYCNESGVINDVNAIAAIANKAGNVMAVVPQLARTELSDPIFKSMHDYIKKGVFHRVAPLNYYPRRESQ